MKVFEFFMKYRIRFKQIKAISIVVLALVFLLNSSCKKDMLGSLSETWSFNSNTYSAVSCVADFRTATVTAANTVSGDVYSNIIISFSDTLPTTGGGYRVARSGTSFGADSLSITIAHMANGMTEYYASIPDTSRAYEVNVTYANGKIGVKGSNVKVTRTSAPLDTISLSFDIRQF